MWSIVGAAVTLIIAVSFWRFQAIGKRRMEVAEAALIALADVEAALQSVRVAFEPAGIIAQWRKEVGGDKDAEVTLNDYYAVKNDRLVDNYEALKTLHKSAVVTRYFFSESVALAINEYAEVWREVGSICRVLATTDREFTSSNEGKKLVAVAIQLNSGDRVAEKLGRARDYIEHRIGRDLKFMSSFIPAWNWSTPKPFKKFGPLT